MSGPIPKQSMFNWKAEDKYKELQNFKLDVSNMLQNYNLGQTERVYAIKHWQVREGLQLTVTLTKEKQMCEMMITAYLRPSERSSNHNLMKW